MTMYWCDVRTWALRVSWAVALIAVAAGFGLLVFNSVVMAIVTGIAYYPLTRLLAYELRRARGPHEIERHSLWRQLRTLTSPHPHGSWLFDTECNVSFQVRRRTVRGLVRLDWNTFEPTPGGAGGTVTADQFVIASQPSVVNRARDVWNVRIDEDGYLALHNGRQGSRETNRMIREGIRLGASTGVYDVTVEETRALVAQLQRAEEGPAQVDWRGPR